MPKLKPARSKAAKSKAAKPKDAEQWIPQRIDELTPRWFAEILGADAPPQSVSIDDIGTDVGFMGKVYRCHLHWADVTEAADGSNGPLPESVIVKVPTQNDENHAAGDGLQMYEREITVYRELRASLGIPMPGFIYGAYDPDPAPWLERPVMFLFDHLPIRGINWLIRQFLKLSGKSKRRYVLVIEDIENARPPTQAEGGSLEDAMAALKVLAAFHAANWMNTEAIESHHRLWSIDRGCRIHRAGYARNLDYFRQHYRSTVSDEMFERLDEIDTRATDLNRALAEPPWTLLHGDYRLDNLLFRPDGDIVVLDFQGLGYGRPAVDVAYFVTTALTVEHRAEEDKLLRTYHQALVDAGVRDYSFDMLVADCATAKEVFAHRIVGAADVLDTNKTDGSDALIDVMQLRVLDWLDPA